MLSETHTFGSRDGRLNGTKEFDLTHELVCILVSMILTDGKDNPTK